MKQLKKYWLTSPATSVIAIICFIMTLLIHFLPILDSQIERAILLGAFYKPFIIVGEWWRLATVGFIHIDFFHLLMNLTCLLQTGLLMERVLGAKKYLILLFGSVIGGSILQLIYVGNTVSVGISGGLFGVFAAEIFMLYYSGAIYSPQVKMSLTRTIVIMILMQFLPNIAVLAHLGGFVAGFFLVIILWPDDRLKQLRLHTLISFLILCMVSGYLSYQNRKIPESEIYYGTDIAILEFEYQLGFQNYSAHMQEKLIELYSYNEGE